MVAGPCGMGVSHRRRIDPRGPSDSRRSVWAAGSHTVGAGNGHVLSAGVGTCRGGRLGEQVPMGRDRRLMGPDGRRLGGRGFVSRRSMARGEQCR